MSYNGDLQKVDESVVYLDSSQDSSVCKIDQVPDIGGVKYEARQKFRAHFSGDSPIVTDNSSPSSSKKRPASESPDNGRHICSQCEVLFSSKSNLNRHLREQHNIDRYYRCHYCRYVALRFSVLQEHVLSHTNPLSFQCAVCEKRFSRNDQLKKHTKKYHS